MRKDRTKLQINRKLRRRPLLDQIRPHGLVLEWLWALPDQKNAALRHGGLAALIDDFVEKFDLARARPIFAETSGDRMTPHMQPIAWPDRPLPANLVNAGLFENRRPHEERIAIHSQQQ